MQNFLFLVQIVLAASVAFVWIFRIRNVIREFVQFGLSDVVRSAVGFAKTALATLLIAGIWYPTLTLPSATLMGLFMVAAQYFHFKANNPLIQRLPSLALLLLSTFVVLITANII